jgi:hypothetical protein
MSVKKFNIGDYDNPVAIAVKKIGGVKKAARKLDTAECVIMLWIRKGFVSRRSCAEILENHTGVPEEDLLRRPEEYVANLSSWLSRLSA